MGTIAEEFAKTMNTGINSLCLPKVKIDQTGLNSLNKLVEDNFRTVSGALTSS